MNTKFILILLVSTLFFISCHTEVEKNQTIMLPGNIKMEFVFIPAGNFLMGSNANELGRQSDEGPQHKVMISKDFYLGKYEVTQEQWFAIEFNNPSVFRNFTESPQYPVDWVSWDDCMLFIEKLNQLGVGKFRLPTEAEWEYACRASTKSRYYWGDDLNYNKLHEFSWAYSRAEGKSHSVGLKPPNNWGLYDMSGNVWEWCSDWFGAYQKKDVVDPVGWKMGKERYTGEEAGLTNPKHIGQQTDMVTRLT